MDLKRFATLQPDKDFAQIRALFERERPKDAFGKPLRDGGWYRVTNLTTEDAEVFIYDEIGGYGIGADQFAQEFNDIRAQNITVRINSFGGVVSDGFAIFNAIRRHKATVTTVVDGMAASAASFIAMAGDKVMMAPHSEMVIHDAHGFVMGNAQDMRQLADFLDKESNNIARVYANRTGGKVEDWRTKMQATTLISDQEAVDYGLADGIEGVDTQNSLNATWTAQYINNLPDSAFAYVEPGGQKDGEGKTVPRSLRHFPHHNADGSVDLPHLRNALARAPQSEFANEALPHLRQHAAAEGVGESNARVVREIESILNRKPVAGGTK